MHEAADIDGGLPGGTARRDRGHGLRGDDKGDRPLDERRRSRHGLRLGRRAARDGWRLRGRTSDGRDVDRWGVDRRRLDGRDVDRWRLDGRDVDRWRLDGRDVDRWRLDRRLSANRRS